MIATIRLFLAALFVLIAAPAWAVDYPPVPSGPVLDQANLLTPEREAALDARLRELSKSTGRALIVVTVPSLQGESIEMYAVKLFEAWGIGGKESDSGLLFLVAPNERKVRIEVGYGLHGYVTDGLSGRIIRQEVTPRFKAGDMPGGIEAGVNALVQQLSRSPQDAKAVAEAAEAAQRSERKRGPDGGTIGMAVVIVLIFLFVLLSFARRATMRGGRRYRSHDDGGIAPIVIWAASEILSNSLRGGDRGGGWGGGGGGWGGGGGFGGGGSGGGGASGDW